MFLEIILFTLLSSAWSLQCYECQGLIDNCLISPVTCKPQEPYCILKAYRVIAGGITTDYLMKSCSTGLECGQNTTLYTGYQAIYATSTCCEYDFCNAGAIQITVFSNYLQCYSCTGYKEDSCTSSSAINCIGVENQCVDVSTLVASGSSTTSSIIKGCGNGAFCNDLQAYNTGDSFSVVNVTCCNTAKCNNRQFSASLPTNINGIRCYSCYETGKNECSANNKSQVNCTGGLYRCMEVLDNNNGKQVALMRGCATESFCRGVIPSLTVPQSQQVLCCTGNLCNNWIFNGYQQTGKGHCLQTLNILYLLILLLPSVTVL
ncbi:urokinase plasminogen activator surface receptor-like [Protopterus annectens]|uniref:urokinase plasminogen activator surface receptor-like n=1 Tax=Protopterus annectens TaxID=7888 RepID=UPI001CFB59AE|nr:urokinase plasminogen activator surface receptor-like [Protopterus annectens]